MSSTWFSESITIASSCLSFSTCVSPVLFAAFHSSKVSSNNVLLNIGVSTRSFLRQCANINLNSFGFSMNALANRLIGYFVHFKPLASPYSFLATAGRPAAASANAVGEYVPSHSAMTTPAVSRGKDLAIITPWATSASAASGASKEHIAASISDGSSAHASKSREMGTVGSSDPSGFMGASAHGFEEEARTILEAASTSPSFK
mmetsp:Transcript_11688/g.22110  ORF Transcript_11688/g.22110 Transcript_11688/m.22110 type:complete len:204 (-) Transcript_11688:411-1022(-)